MAVFEMQNARKAFGALEVLKGVSLKVEKGEVVSIIGPSGGGKSTMLRCATLLETMDAGTLSYGENVAAREENGRSVYAGRSALAQVRRQFGLVFQQFDLFPHYTVLKNVCFPMELSGTPAAQARKRALELLDLVGLREKADAYPSQLSGGQKQRVAIARMLMQQAPIMVFDDSLSAVDAETDAKIRTALRDTLHSATVLLISHRVTTLMQADRILVLDGGRVSALGAHRELIDRPGIYRDIYDIQMRSDDRALVEEGGNA